MSSTRLPGKILKPILGEPMLARMLERVKRTTSLDAIVVATTDTPEDDATTTLAERCSVEVFRGDERDVLNRFYNAAKKAEADIVVRLTGDCPLMDPIIIDEVVAHFKEARGTIDYCGTPANYPEGLDIEIFNFSVLEEAKREAKLPSEREHVTPYIKNHPERFICEVWRRGEEDNSGMHWSVDTQTDFDFATNVFEQLYPINSCFSDRFVVLNFFRNSQIGRKKQRKMAR